MQRRDFLKQTAVAAAMLSMSRLRTFTFPYDLRAEERALGLNGMREKYIWSAGRSRVNDAA